MSKTLGEMTPAERKAAVDRALGRFQAELDQAAPEIERIMNEAIDGTTGDDGLSTLSPLDFDTQLAELYEQAAKIERARDSLNDAIHRAAGDRQEWIGRRHVWRFTMTEAEQMIRTQEILPAHVASGYRYSTAAELISAREAQISALASVMLRIGEHDAEYARRPWPRFFPCENSDGHIHTSLRGCPTVRWDTLMTWRPDLSGRTVAEAVDKLGPTLCSVCFPLAPVELRQNRSDITRTEREKARRAREEATFIKQLHGDEVFRCDRAWVETVAACKDVLRHEVELRDYFGRGEHPSHREYWEQAHLARAVLIAREEAHPGTGATAEQVDKIIANAVKKNRSEGARIL